MNLGTTWFFELLYLIFKWGLVQLKQKTILIYKVISKLRLCLPNHYVFRWSFRFIMYEQHLQEGGG